MARGSAGRAGGKVMEGMVRLVKDTDIYPCGWSLNIGISEFFKVGNTLLEIHVSFNTFMLLNSIEHYSFMKLMCIYTYTHNI